MDIDKLTELAQKIMQVDDTERKYKAVANLQQKIVEDIGGIISACTDLIKANTILRFGDYQSNVFMMYGQFNRAKKCINLLKDHYNDVVEEYEKDTEGKRAERKQKLEEYRQVVSIQLLPPKNVGAECYTEVIRDVSPDIIYCQRGIYRQYSEVCNSFEYSLCRKIQQSSSGDLKTLFQKVCLYIALKNEKAMMREELLLLGVTMSADEQEQPQETNKGGVEAIKLPTELDTTEAKKKPTVPKQKGRKAKPLIDYFPKDTKQDDCNRIKALCDGRQGKDLALVILVAIQEGIMSKPTFRTIEKECNNVGSESGFCSYMNKGLKAYTKEEFEGMKKLLSQ